MARRRAHRAQFGVVGDREREWRTAGRRARRRRAARRANELAAAAGLPNATTHSEKIIRSLVATNYMLNSFLFRLIGMVLFVFLGTIVFEGSRGAGRPATAAPNLSNLDDFICCIAYSIL